MALPGAGKRLKPPKGKGVKWRDVAGQVASSPALQPNQDDPALVSIGKTTVTYAAVGMQFGGPIGAGIGATIGFFAGIFGASAREKAELAKMRERVRQYAESKQKIDTQFVEARISQLGQAGRAVRSDVNQIEHYLHQSLGQELNQIARPKRTTSFSQTGRIGKIQSAQFDKILLAQSKVLSDKTTQTLAGRKRTLEEIEDWKDDIENADTDVTRQYGHERWASQNLDKEVGHSEAYKIAEDKGRSKELRRQLESS